MHDADRDTIPIDCHLSSILDVLRIGSTILSSPLAIPPAVHVEDLTVSYRDKPVLWDIDLTVPQGVLMAIVGPNGAGKTTLIKAILGLVRPVAGTVSILGRPYREQRRAYRLRSAARNRRLGFSDDRDRRGA